MLRVSGVVALLIAFTSPAFAFKWYQCPTPPVPVYPSTLGAAGSPFIHAGHRLSVYLNDQQIAASGGFSASAGENEVNITFASLFGDPVPLVPRFVSAASAGVLTFVFPDGRDEVGRALAGPVEVVVRTNGIETARIDANDLVGLPRSVDLAPLLLGDDPDLIIQATIGPDGDLWIPAFFSGHYMGMPGCEGNFIMPLPMEIGGAVVVGGNTLFPFDPLSRMRQVTGYLGDMVINGTDFYGLLYPQRIQLVQVGDTLGVSVCRLNDAEDLVLRIQGNEGWSGPNSPFRVLARDSSPLNLQLRKAAPLPRDARATDNSQSRDAPGRVDSFGNQCLEMPKIPGGTSGSTNVRR